MSAAVTEARTAGSNAIVMYTIGLGGHVDSAFLQDMADVTGGDMFLAPSADDLAAIYATIFEKIKLRLVQ